MAKTADYLKHVVVIIIGLGTIFLLWQHSLSEGAGAAILGGIIGYTLKNGNAAYQSKKNGNGGPK